MMFRERITFWRTTAAVNRRATGGYFNEEMPQSSSQS